MNVEDVVRKIAKSNKWQTIYTLTRESGFQIFENNTNYTQYQILFLNFLSFYSTLYTEVALNDIPTYIFKDDIYEDAYMYYKRKQKVKDFSSTTDTTTKENDKDFAWVFRKPKSR